MMDTFLLAAAHFFVFIIALEIFWFVVIEKIFSMENNQEVLRN